MWSGNFFTTATINDCSLGGEPALSGGIRKPVRARELGSRFCRHPPRRRSPTVAATAASSL
jgi:hypothetical protein